jgi:hypothetical protein
MLSTVRVDLEAVSWTASIDRLSVEHLDLTPRSGDVDAGTEAWGSDRDSMECRRGGLVFCA